MFKTSLQENFHRSQTVIPASQLDFYPKILDIKREALEIREFN
jgi:hypothetical protein